MARLLNVLLVALLASMAMGVNIKTDFTIPLPAGPSSDFYTSGYGDMYYTVGSGGDVFAVDLKTKAVLWSKTFAGQILTGVLAGPNGVLLAQDASVTSFSAKGDFQWATGEFTFSGNNGTYTFIGSTLYTFGADGTNFYTVDLSTGSASAIETDGAGKVYSDYAVIIQAGSINYNAVAYKLPEMTVLFEIKNVAGFLGADSNNILVTNISYDGGFPYPETLLVYDAKTKQKVGSVAFVNGITQSGFVPQVSGGEVLLICGLETLRLVVANLKTGAIVSQRYLGNAGSGSGGSAVADGILYAISGTTLLIENIMTGKNLATAKGVPSSPSSAIVVYGPICRVPNLQGWTEWGQDGTYLGRNEMSPSSNPTVPYLYGQGVYVDTQGASVVGFSVSS